MTFDGFAWDEKIGWYDPQMDFCVEEECFLPATHERLLGMYEDNFVYERVCYKHVDNV